NCPTTRSTRTSSTECWVRSTPGSSSSSVLRSASGSRPASKVEAAHCIPCNFNLGSATSSERCPTAHRGRGGSVVASSSPGTVAAHASDGAPAEERPQRPAWPGNAGHVRLVLVGGGRMGEALLTGLLASEWAAPSELAVVEKLAERRETLEK